MTTATISNSPVSLRHHVENVAHAARAFAQSLFAAQGRQFAAQEVRSAKEVTLRDKVKGRRQLMSLASQYETLSPNLAAELRAIAARD